jgi:hypothetical protein
MKKRPTGVQTERVRAFLDDVRALCKKHNVSLAREDGHGNDETD